MAEIDFENGRNSNFEGLVTLTLTFDPAIRHIVLQQSSTSTYIPTFIQIEETFCGRTDVRTDGRTFSPSILLGRLSEVDLKITVTKTTPCPKKGRNFDKLGKLLIIFGKNHPDNLCDGRIVKCPINTFTTLRNDDVIVFSH